MQKGYEDLANAIVIQAVKDYRQAKKSLVICEKGKVADKRREEIAEVETFMHSQYFKMLTNLDPEVLLSKLENEPVVLNDKEDVI